MISNRASNRIWAALAGSLLLAACSGDPSADPRAVARARIQAENAIIIQAVFPRSVEFRNERIFFRGSKPVVCGEFNGLNRKGDYAGFTRFFVVGEDIGIEDRHHDFRDRWNATCAGV